tara:strand:+ start:1620 stop:2399 length:780 start_codon:yes stop_codon:yes gene_type:complete
MDEMNKLNLLLRFGEDKEYYSDNEYVTNSMLGLLNKSPQHLLQYMQGAKQESKALDIGKAFHTMVLEPSKLDDDVVVFEGKARRGKVWDEFSLENSDKTIVSTSEWNMINNMSNVLFENKEAMSFINSSNHEVVEVWEDLNLGVSCKGKADMVINLYDNKKVLIDLKTTRDSSVEAFKRSAYNYGYDRQAAFYLDGFDADEFWFVVIEKESPYRVGIYQASEEFISRGRDKNLNLLKSYKEYFINKDKDVHKFYFKGEL